MRGFLAAWLPPLALMGLIFCLSAQPDLPHVPGPWLDTLIKKSAHMLVYGLLAWFYQRALFMRATGSRRTRWVSLLLAILYGLSDEIHQRFVPGRNGRLVDVVIDGVGAGGAMLLDWWRTRRLARPRPAPRAAR